MDSLILIPTEIERKLFLQHGAGENLTVQRCGFGPVVAAARSAFLIAKYKPSHCLLVGIAGVYPAAGAELKIGTAATFNSVGCFGVGAGSGEGFQTAGQMGWQQWPPTDTENAIGDSLELFVPDATSANQATVVGQLLTVTSAAANETEVQQRRRLFPAAVAEDMEGFAVAVACHLAGIPLTIVRGFSNRAGDRNQSNWQIETAMEAAAELVDEMMSQTS
jgi:futalosine hydrolase